MKDDLILNYNIDESKTDVIYNPAIISKVSEKNSYKKSHEIIYVGRLENQKGLDNLLKIFSMVLTKDDSLILRIIGEGSLFQKLIDLSISLGINNNVVFEGYKENIAAYYIQAKATVLTSHFEGMPNTLLESLYLGTPIISFDCPSGPSEIVLHGVNGFLVPFLDNTDFAQRILETTSENLFDPKEVIETSKKFHIDKIINQYERLVVELYPRNCKVCESNRIKNYYFIEPSTYNNKIYHYNECLYCGCLYQIENDTENFSDKSTSLSKTEIN